MAHIAEGRYDAGIDDLKRAYDILPHANVLYNIARAYLDEGDLENALRYYRRYLEGAPGDRDEVAHMVAVIESRLRRQQSELVEAQRPQPAANSDGVLPSRSTAVTSPPRSQNTGPNESAGPAGASESGRTTSGATTASRASVPAGALKTEEVFEETVVTASKAAQSPLDAPSSTSIITEQDIRLSGITKIPELLRRLAGVDLMEVTGAETEVSLRGFNQRLSNKVLVLVDGRSVYLDLLGATFWAMLSIGVEDIERIEVVRGPGSALYGADAFNGVINIITRKPGEGGSGLRVGYGDHDAIHGTIYASGRDEDFAYRISGGYDYQPRWSREVPTGRTDLQLGTSDQDASQRTTRFDGTVTRRIGRDATIGIQGGYTNGFEEQLGVGPVNDILVNPFASGDATLFLVTKHVEAHAFVNSLSGTNAINSSYLGQSNLVGHFDLNTVDAEARLHDRFSLGTSVDDDLHVGAEYRLKAVSWVFEAQDEVENHAGVFVHDEVRFASRFAAVGDYRADYVPYLNRVVQSPRVATLYHPTARSTIRASVGTAFRTPTFLESYIGFLIPLPLTGAAQASNGQRPDDPAYRVNPEQIVSAEVGYLTSDSDYLTLDSSFFYNHASNLIDIQPIRPVTVGDLANPRVATAPDPQSGLYPIFFGGFENQCQGYDVYGAEVGVRTFPVEGLDAYANGTLMHVKQDNGGCTAEQLSLLANDARTSVFKLNAGLQLRSHVGVDGSVDFHYVSSQSWAEQVVDVQRQRIEYQSLHLDPYTLVNASIGYRFVRQRAEIRAVGFNLLDDGHREHPFGQFVGRRIMGFFSYRF
jgi:iron complex outermembrane receptor protein